MLSGSSTAWAWGLSATEWARPFLVFSAGAALRFFQAQELVQQLRSEKLRQEIQVGLDQARQGDVAPLDLEAIKAKGREILQSRASGAGRA